MEKYLPQCWPGLDKPPELYINDDDEEKEEEEEEKRRKRRRRRGGGEGGGEEEEEERYNTGRAVSVLCTMP